MMTRKILMRSIAGLALGLTLSACGSLLPKPAPADAVYRLGLSQSEVTPKADALVIRIERPAGARIYQTQDILVSRENRRLSVLERARWSDSMPVIIQNAFLDVMAERDALVGILPVSGARTEARIHLTIEAFEAVFDEAAGDLPLATVEYSVTFADSQSRALRGTHHVRQTLRASEPRVSSIVAAMDSANRAALNDIADWLETQNTQG